MKRVFIFALLALLARNAFAKELSDREVSERLQFLEMRLKSEGHQAHEWEAGWSLVYVGGFGYAVYEIGHDQNKPAFADGVIGVLKSLVGGTRLVLAPRNSSLGAHPLDMMPEDTPQDRLTKLVKAESLLRRNAVEARRRHWWLPHVINAAIAVAGGGIIWATGDFWKGFQSATVGTAVGEVSIWTQPWSANNDEKDYRKNFGDFVGASGTSSTVAKGLQIRATPTGFGLTF